MRSSLFISALVLATIHANAAAAQQLTPAGVRGGDRSSRIETQLPVAGQQTSRAEELPIRVLLGAGGSLAGGFAGIMIANALPHHDCNCDDPGLAEAIIGGTIGSSLGAALAASLPTYGSTCSFGKRFLLSAGASALGATAGGLFGASVESGGAGAMVGYVSGAGLGAGLASAFCKSST